MRVKYSLLKNLRSVGSARKLKIKIPSVSGGGRISVLLCSQSSTLQINDHKGSGTIVAVKIYGAKQIRTETKPSTDAKLKFDGDK